MNRTEFYRLFWPMPTANNYECEPEVFLARREREKAKHRNGNGFGLTLGMAARLWPTPSARDWRSGKASPETMARNSRPLNEVVTARENWPTPVASDAGKDRGSSAGWGLRDAAGGALNPTWVEWLMGYPEGWTDCGD